MGSNATFGGISRGGSSGSYIYVAKAGFEDEPVVYVSFYDALRFANWLHDGEGSGDTETGAYTLLGGTSTPSNGTTVVRNALATTFLPSENEWYEAAYFDGTTFFDYSTGTNVPTGCVAPGSDTGNAANCHPYAHPPGSLTNVGAYSLSDSPYGTFDQGGNVWEWNEQIVSGVFRGMRGGSWYGDVEYLAASYRALTSPTYEYAFIGFRVASLVPEPGTGLLVTAGMRVLATRRKRLAKAL